MSEPDDLLGKADAFLKRYHPVSAPEKHDVPVLTEVIDDGGAPSASPASTTVAPSASPASTTTAAPLAKADFLELEKKLQQSIDAHVQRSLAGANAQLRADLEAFVRETVARAVAGEIARLRGSSRGP